jgi:hypothetical protein
MSHKMLQHVAEFEQQFISVYGNRFLFLCPPNECGVPKFLPTTVHPTHLHQERGNVVFCPLHEKFHTGSFKRHQEIFPTPSKIPVCKLPVQDITGRISPPRHLHYQNFYEFGSAAEFVADHINYEELKPADRYPRVIPSPHSVLKWQAGDCFDIALVLTSLLVGVGYDAYCVSGFAPKHVTRKNETRAACPYAVGQHAGAGGAGATSSSSSSSAAATGKEGAGDASPGRREEVFAIPRKPAYNKSQFHANQARQKKEEKELAEAEALCSDSDNDEAGSDSEDEATQNMDLRRR